VVAKDLEVYATSRPPPSYSLDIEIEGVMREADAAGFERFHLVGYSAGGACATAFAARHAERLHSLALLEPAWLGNHNQSAKEQRLWRELHQAMELPPEQMLPEFIRLQLAPASASGAAAAVGWPSIALMAAFERHRLEPDRVRGFGSPAYYALGALSNPDLYGRMAERARSLFADFTLEIFQDRHHFDPPHRVEPERLARSLLALWQRSEPGGGA
jgi:pimeloyl-ACP methyl ester carboxylesterase